MSRLRFVTWGLLLLALGALLGLGMTVPRYQFWLAERWLPDALAERLLNLDYCVASDIAAWQIWLPIWLVPLLSLLPAVPALGRIRALERSRGWVVLGLLPGVNLLLYLFLIVSPRPRWGRLSIREGLLLLLMLPAAAILYGCLVLYLPWLAARS